LRHVYLLCFGIILIGLQTMIANLFFSGRLVVEISLLLVLSAGFNLTWIKGGILCFIIGFLLDCFMGSVSGLFALIYLTFFLLAKFVSPRVYAEKTWLSACVLLLKECWSSRFTGLPLTWINSRISGMFFYRRQSLSAFWPRCFFLSYGGLRSFNHAGITRQAE
jgi:cell shape-determining protein MreD